MKKLSNINSLFGTYTVSEDFSVKFDDEGSAKQAFQDYIYRGKDGIGKKILKSHMASQAVGDPLTLINQARTRINTLVEDIEEIFARTYQNVLSRGLPLDKTKKIVIEEVDKYIDRRIKEFKEDYPEELLKRAVKKLAG